MTSYLTKTLVLCAVAAMLAATNAYDPPRFHGIDLDEKHKVMLEQRYNQIEVFLSMRTRAQGGGPVAPSHRQQEGEVFRFEDKRVLARVRVDVLQVARPNNLSNPGTLYRIYFQGVELEPDYAVVHTVRDIEAREILLAEFQRMAARAQGVDREALHFGGLMAVGVLQDTSLFPAELPATIERSIVGRVRGLDETLQRRALPQGRTLNPLGDEEQREERQLEAPRPQDYAPGKQRPVAATGAPPGLRPQDARPRESARER
mgnify:CR=1 FL=1